LPPGTGSRRTRQERHFGEEHAFLGTVGRRRTRSRLQSRRGRWRFRQLRAARSRRYGRLRRHSAKRTAAGAPPKGKGVISLFQGGWTMGPRALGKRLDPGDPAGRAGHEGHLKFKIKRPRGPFSPFAPFDPWRPDGPVKGLVRDRRRTVPFMMQVLSDQGRTSSKGKSRSHPCRHGFAVCKTVTWARQNPTLCAGLIEAFQEGNFHRGPVSESCSTPASHENEPVVCKGRGESNGRLPAHQDDVLVRGWIPLIER